MKTILSILASVLNASLVYSATPILHYEPEIVELTGVIENQIFPGPPEYDSIAKGDRAEKGWYLRLSEVVDVVETKNDAPSAESETERRVKIMQLTWGDDNLKPVIRNVTKLKKRVRLKGHLFHRWSGHHHSRVLMWVDKLEEIKP